MVVLGVGMVTVAYVVCVRHRVRMGTGQKLRIDVVGPLWE